MINTRLSPQAEWYLRGLKRTHVCYEKTTEPTAMAELVKVGLARRMGFVNYYVITQAGKDYDLNT